MTIATATSKYKKPRYAWTNTEDEKYTPIPWKNRLLLVLDLLWVCWHLPPWNSAPGDMPSGGKWKHQRRLGAQQGNVTDERPAGANPPGLNHWSTVERERTRDRESLWQGLKKTFFNSWPVLYKMPHNNAITTQMGCSEFDFVIPMVQESQILDSEKKLVGMETQWAKKKIMNNVSERDPLTSRLGGKDLQESTWRCG